LCRIFRLDDSHQNLKQHRFSAIHIIMRRFLNTPLRQPTAKAVSGQIPLPFFIV